MSVSSTEISGHGERWTLNDPVMPSLENQIDFPTRMLTPTSEMTLELGDIRSSALTDRPRFNHPLLKRRLEGVKQIMLVHLLPPWPDSDGTVNNDSGRCGATRSQEWINMNEDGHLRGGGQRYI